MREEQVHVALDHFPAHRRAVEEDLRVISPAGEYLVTDAHRLRRQALRQIRIREA